jgi:MFS family permease
MNKNNGTQQDQSTYPPPGYAWYVVVVLTTAYVLSFLDRQILTLLVEPIKRDLGISDTQMSLLLGFAFAIFYTVLGIPIGRMADRYSRRLIIGVGITTWCAMTAMCGLARNYTQLFIARVGVGVGEATLNPSALSLISDYFPPTRRGRAISFYSMGVGLGAGIALIIGGQIISWVFESPRVVLPDIGELYAWQTVFLLVGLPGLLIAILMGSVREPARHGRIRLQNAAGRETEHLSIRAALEFLASRWQTYGALFLGMSGATVLGEGVLSWLPAMFMRTWDWDISQVAFAQGSVMLVAAPLGVNLGGWLADRWYGKGRKAAHFRVLIYSCCVMVAASVLLPLVPTPELAVVLLAPQILGSAAMTAVGAAALMIITPNQLRGQVAALYYFVISLTGLTIGPTAIAMMTDYVFRDESALRYSMAIISAVWGVLAILIIFLGRSYYRNSVMEAEEWNG